MYNTMSFECRIKQLQPGGKNEGQRKKFIMQK